MTVTFLSKTVLIHDGQSFAVLDHTTAMNLAQQLNAYYAQKRRAELKEEEDAGRGKA